MSKSKRIVGPFQSDYGSFNPGDPAIAITVCTGSVNVARVEYLGYIEREVFDWHTKKKDTAKFAQVRRPTNRYTAFYKGTDTVAVWPYDERPVEYRPTPGTTITTLQYNRLIPANVSADQLMKVIQE